MVDQDYSVTVADVVAVKGNTAVLRCAIPAEVREHVRVTSWLHEEGTAIEIFPEKVSIHVYAYYYQRSLCGRDWEESRLWFL